MRFKSRKQIQVIEHPEGGSVSVSLLTTSQLSALRAKHVSWRVTDGVAHEALDAAGFSRELWHRQITGWDGMEGPDGAEMAFSRANLDRVIDEWPEFFSWIGDEIEKRKTDASAVEDALLGN